MSPPDDEPRAPGARGSAAAIAAGHGAAEAPESLLAPREAPGEAGGTPLAELRAIRAGERGPGPHALDLRGRSLVGVDLAGVDLTRARLAGADLSRADLRDAVLLQADLAGATLFEADLTGAELAGADLTAADLRGVSARGAGLGSARLDGAVLALADLRDATLSDASLERADLRTARLGGARLLAADLRRADLSRADLREAELGSARLDHAALRGVDLRGASLGGVRGYKSACWIQADVRDVDFNHAHLCRRHVLDQNYIEEFRNQNAVSRCVYYVWWLTSDCGRSLLRWSVLTLVIALAFAGLYALVDVDWGGRRHGISPIYFSVVTLTTLGYGDVVPASPAAQALCMLEVFAGYLMLGGLLSIFSNKMARRAE